MTALTTLPAVLHRFAVALPRRDGDARVLCSGCVWRCSSSRRCSPRRISSSRGTLQDLFFVLTLVTLAQYWNLLAGYAGILSIGQQAYVGLGGYMLFALTMFAGLDPVPAILVAGLIGAVVAVPLARLLFRLSGAYLGVGAWVLAEVFRLVFAQVKSLGGGTGASLPTAVTNGAWSVKWLAAAEHLRAAAARDRLAYWLAVLLAVGTVMLVYAPAALAAGLGAGGDPRQRGRLGFGRRRSRCEPRCGSMSSPASAPA